MKFLSNIGRTWTTRELERAFAMARSGHGNAYIARWLDRTVDEIKAVL